MPTKSPMFSVPEPEVDAVLQEVLLRRRAMDRKPKRRSYDRALGATPEEAEASLARMREDIGAYGRYVFGLEPAKVHALWNRVADDVIRRRVPQNKVLFLAPPNTAKSTWNSLIRPTHYLGQHPDHNVLFFTSSEPQSRTFHSAVESVLRDNEKYRSVFPDPSVRPDRKRGWSTDGLYLRGTPAFSKDGAYRAVGINASIMGARAHGIILDDPMNQQQAQSDTEQARAKRYYDQTIVPRLQPGEGWLIAVMTRFHENDLASHLIRLAEESGDWLVIRTPQIATNEPGPDPLKRRTGALLWPERLNEAYVSGEQKRMTIAEFNLVHQCIVGWTRILLDSNPRRLYRRWYEGPLVEVITASGQRLSGTPNHPVLTQQGWVSLGSLAVGDDVFRSSAFEIVLPSSDDVDDGHPQIGEVFAAAAIAGNIQTRPATQDDFHGDGFHPEIDVVDVDGLLVDRLQSQFPELLRYPSFGRFDSHAPLLERKRPLPLMLLSKRSAVDDVVRGFDASKIALGSITESASDSGLTLRSQRLSEFPELIADSSGRDLVGLRQFIECGSPAITLEKIVRVVTNPTWAGHVFNLETEIHEYVAEGIVTHNCDPTGLGGDIFENESWFQGLPSNFWSDIMPRCQILQFWDLAFSEAKKTCFTVGITIAVDPELNIYILHVLRKRMNTNDTEDEMVKVISVTRPLVIGVETDKFHQQTIISMVKRILDRKMCNIRLIQPKDDKISRARLPASRAQAGKVFINKDAPWYRAFISECLGFPNTKYKDQVDAFSGVTLLVEHLQDLGRQTRRIEVEHVMA